MVVSMPLALFHAKFDPMACGIMHERLQHTEDEIAMFLQNRQVKEDGQQDWPAAHLRALVNEIYSSFID